jgi:hypothetical protein
MTRIKKYDEFVNEEIDLKRALASAALGASLAFGNPSVAQTQEPVKTEISISQTQEDFLQVVNVDSTMKKEDIQKKIVNQLYSSPTVRMTSNTPGKIVCNVNFSSKPDYSNGRAYGTMTVEFKDGRYKVSFTDIQFDYQGQQPTTPLQSATQNAGRQIKGMATNAALSKIRNPLLQTVARGAISATNQRGPFVDKPNMTYQQSFGNNQEFANGIDSEISTIMSTLNSAFQNNSTSSGW